MRWHTQHLGQPDDQTSREIIVFQVRAEHDPTHAGEWVYEIYDANGHPLYTSAAVRRYFEWAWIAIEQAEKTYRSLPLADAN